MPELGQLIGNLVSMVGESLGASSLRLGPIPTLVVGVVALAYLGLLARPTTRWITHDLGRLAAVGRALALAAEAGATASVRLGTAGIARATAAVERLQTLAAMGLLDQLARGAARAGVRLRATTNDPLAAVIAHQLLAEAHRATETPERASRSSAIFVGEGRIVAGAGALVEPPSRGVALTAGSLGEESILLQASDGDAGWVTGGTASASQLASVVLGSDASLLGPELFLAGSDQHAGSPQRSAALADNRLIGLLVGALALGTLATLLGASGLPALLVGR